jgi:hypothetical protein
MRAGRGRYAVLGVVAAAATLTAGTAAARTPHSAHQICVALVVDARALGAGVNTTCAKVPAGATGLDVLQAGGHRIGFRRDGLICTIDGLPATGCAAVDDSHYWAYFHRAPGSTQWTYSTEGAATFQPANASTEGWVYNDGTSLTPDNIPYRKICPPSVTPPSATATPSASRSAPASSGASPQTSHHLSPSAGDRTGSPTDSANAVHTQSPPSTSPTVEPSPPTSRPPGAAHPARHASATGNPSATASASASTAPTQVALSGSSGSGSGGSAGSAGHIAGLIIGIVVVAGLGILAALRLRRSRSPS